MISKLDMQLWTLSPPEEAAKPSTPWVLKTPTIVNKTKSQSKYLNRRIRRHQSSSLKSIIKALKYLLKGAIVATHKATLLAAKNKELR
jgi:spore germination protein GerM